MPGFESQPRPSISKFFSITMLRENVTPRREVESVGLRVIFKNNKGVIIILPPAWIRVFGLKEALKLLDVQGFVAAIGDSEIDQELLEVVDFGGR